MPPVKMPAWPRSDETFDLEILDAGVEGQYLWDITKANSCMIENWGKQQMGYEGRGQFVFIDINPEIMIWCQAVKIEINQEHIAKVDPATPALVVRFQTDEGPREYLIDGNHRIRRAIQLKWNAFPVYVLSSWDEQMCRISKRPLDAAPDDMVAKWAGYTPER